MKKTIAAVKALKDARPARPSLSRLAREAEALAAKITGAKVCNCPRKGLVKMNCPTHGTPAPLRGYTSAERKAMPLQTLLAEYFPDAFMALARHSLKANIKHNGPDAPMHWARKKSTDHLNCAARHLLTPDAIDPDTLEIELVGAFWRCGAALQLREERRLVAEGILPLSGVIPDGDG